MQLLIWKLHSSYRGKNDRSNLSHFADDLTTWRDWQKLRSIISSAEITISYVGEWRSSSCPTVSYPRYPRNSKYSEIDSSPASPTCLKRRLKIRQSTFAVNEGSMTGYSKRFSQTNDKAGEREAAIVNKLYSTR